MTRIIALVLVVTISQVFAQEPSYREAIAAVEGNLIKLQQLQRQRALTAAEQKDLFAAIGQLREVDPLSALMDETNDNIAVLNPGDPSSAQDHSAVEQLTQFKLLTMEMQRRATTQAEANAFARILRRFIVRHDLQGATAWVKAQ